VTPRRLVLLDAAVPSPLSNRRRLAPVPAAGELKRSAALGDAIGANSAHTLNIATAPRPGLACSASAFLPNVPEENLNGMFSLSGRPSRQQPTVSKH